MTRDEAFAEAHRLASEQIAAVKTLTEVTRRVFMPVFETWLRSAFPREEATNATRT